MKPSVSEENLEREEEIAYSKGLKGDFERFQANIQKFQRNIQRFEMNRSKVSETSPRLTTNYSGVMINLFLYLQVRIL